MATRMKKLKIILLTLMITLLTAVPAFAYPHNGGYGRSISDTYQQAYANIKIPTYPWTYFPSFSSSYTMLADYNGSSWAQTGWTKNNGQGGKFGVWYFSQVKNYPDDPVDHYGSYGPAENSTHAYNTYVSGGNFVFKVDSTQIYSEPQTWDAQYYEFSDEIANYNAAFPGYSSNHAVYSGVKVIKNEIQTIIAPSLNFYSDLHGMLSDSSYSSTAKFETWDDRY